MRYGVEQAGAGDEHRPDVGTHVEPEHWHVVRVFNADAVPMPLRFDTLDQALAYTLCCCPMARSERTKSSRNSILGRQQGTGRGGRAAPPGQSQSPAPDEAEFVGCDQTIYGKFHRSALYPPSGTSTSTWDDGPARS